jgi:hypothetical protein
MNSALNEAQEVDVVDVLIWNHCQALPMEEQHQEEDTKEQKFVVVRMKKSSE